jgi:hypothetical protein
LEKIECHECGGAWRFKVGCRENCMSHSISINAEINRRCQSWQEKDPLPARKTGLEALEKKLKSAANAA